MSDNNKGVIVISQFPESFNELRKQLATNHQDVWAKVSYCMVHDQAMFVELMNEQLGFWLLLPYTADMGIDACCKGWLRALERKPKVATMSALDTIHPRNVRGNAAAKPYKTGSPFADCETSLMTEKQIDVAVTKGYTQK